MNTLSSNPKSHHTSKLGASKLCLVCGDHFSKAALPSHYKAKYIGKPAKLQALSVAALLTNPSSSLNNDRVKEIQRTRRDSKSNEDLTSSNNRTNINQNYQSMKSSESDPDVREEELPRQTSDSKKSQPEMTFDFDSGETSRPKSIFDDDDDDQPQQQPIKRTQQKARKRIATTESSKSTIPPQPKSSNNTFDESDDVYQPPSTLYPCHICKRSFAQTDRLEKHLVACQKSADKPRKVFDASKARVKGTDLEKYNAPGSKKKAADATDTGKKSNWRAKHQEFQNMVKVGGSGSDPSPKIANPDYVLCTHCSRRFNQLAAERHIPICKESKLRTELRTGKKNGGGGGGVSLERSKRMSYDPRRKASSPRK